MIRATFPLLRTLVPLLLAFALGAALAQGGASAPTADGWSAANGRIYRGGAEVRLHGLNWFGMDTPERVPHGLWSGRPLGDFLDQTAGLGFNALRLPLCPETIRPGFPVNENYQQVGEDGRAVLEAVLTAMGERGMFALLDIHTSECGNFMSGGPLAADYGEAAWIADVEELARLSLEHPHVVGIDLYNEPHDLTWSAWRDLASRAGQAALAINPEILIFVEGVGGASPSGEHGANWGGNLFEAAGGVPGIPPERLVFSPHAYGHSVFEQPYFSDPDFPANMPAIWDAHFGHLLDAGWTLAPGEFGGRYTGDDRVWQDAFVDYLLERDVRSFFYWSLNPNSGDTGGLLLDDWQTVDEGKLELLQRLMAAE